MYCLKCRYPLHKLSSDRCPECGRWFNPDDSATYAPKAQRTLPLPEDGFAAILMAITCWAILWLMPVYQDRSPSLMEWAPFMLCCAGAIGFAVGGLRRRDDAGGAGFSIAALLMAVPAVLLFAYGIGADVIWEYWTYWHWRMP